MSVSAVTDAAIAVLILLVMTSPAHAVCWPQDAASETRRRNNVGQYCARDVRRAEPKEFATAACLGEFIVRSKESKGAVAALSHSRMRADVASSYAGGTGVGTKKKGAPKRPLKSSCEMAYAE
jgi:hypothetical protein